MYCVYIPHYITTTLLWLQFKSLPAYGLYNFTKNKWTKVDKELTEPYQAMALLVLSTGLE